MRRNVAAPPERSSPKDSSNLPLEVHDLTVAYHKRPVLYGIDLTIPKGSLVGIIGPNGAGKSTLIKAIMGLLPLSAGWVKVFGKPFRQSCHRVGYVPQRESVDWDFPVSVMDVVLMGRYGRLRLAQRPTKQDEITGGRPCSWFTTICRARANTLTCSFC